MDKETYIKKYTKNLINFGYTKSEANEKAQHDWLDYRDTLILKCDKASKRGKTNKACSDLNDTKKRVGKKIKGRR